MLRTKPLIRPSATFSPLTRGEGARCAVLPRPAKRGEGPRSGGEGNAGFTVAELITVVAIVGILASIALPVASFSFRRQKEILLRDRLRRITDAIDRYHDLQTMKTTTVPGTPGTQMASPIQAAQPQALGSEGYPKDLDELLKGVKLTDGRTVHLIRERDLIDPMTGDKKWTTRSTTDDPDTTSSDGNNVFEVHSTSTALALDGKTHYNEW